MEEKDDVQKNTEPKASDVLHDHTKLSSLRTYQGDMAEFIHEKDESVASIALKEKAHREEVQRQTPEVPKKSHLRTVLAISISLILLVIGAGATFYISKSINQNTVSKVQLSNTLIPYTDTVNLDNLTKATLKGVIEKGVFSDGVTLFLLGGANENIQKKDFLEQANVSLPNTLERNLKEEMALGVFKAQTGKISPFVILTVREFGGTFAGMLEWENTMAQDLDFAVLGQVSSTTPEWRDVIVKNKDIRALLTTEGASLIAYTFINKQTILIMSDMDLVPDINSIYIGSSFSR